MVFFLLPPINQIRKTLKEDNTAGSGSSDSGMHALLTFTPVKEFCPVSRTYEMIMVFDPINPLLEIIRNAISHRDSPCSSTTALLASPSGTVLYQADTLLDHSIPPDSLKSHLGFRSHLRHDLTGLRAFPVSLRAQGTDPCHYPTYSLSPNRQEQKLSPCLAVLPWTLHTIPELSEKHQKGSTLCPDVQHHPWARSSLPPAADGRQDLPTWSGTWGRCRSPAPSAAGWRGPGCSAASQGQWTEAAGQRLPLGIGNQNCLGSNVTVLPKECCLSLTWTRGSRSPGSHSYGTLTDRCLLFRKDPPFFFKL